MDTISISFAILTFFVVISYKSLRGETISLLDLVKAILAGGTFPTSIVLIISTFSPGYLALVNNLSFIITMAGFILLFVASKTILSILDSDRTRSGKP